MKTLHFNAVGEYTGYSVNKSSNWEKITGGFGAVATILGGIMTMWSAGCQVNGMLQARKAAKKISNSNADGFEDPK